MRIKKGIIRWALMFLVFSFVLSLCSCKSSPIEGGSSSDLGGISNSISWSDASTTATSNNEVSSTTSTSKLPTPSSVNNTTTNDKTTTTTATTTTKPFVYENVEYRMREEAEKLKLTNEVLARSIINKGNTVRIANVIKKAMRGESVTIGVIGGSITEGTAASARANKYAERFRAWWEQAFPKSHLIFVNAGMGATNSLMGVHRVEAHLLNRQPDLVIIEFTVNDGTEDIYKESYESLVRRILKQPNSPAVISLFMMNQTGANAEKAHKPIAMHYDLPIISYKAAVWPDNGEKLYTWGQLSPDNIHPNDTGHAIVSELLIHYVNTIRAEISGISGKVEGLPKAITANRFESGELLNSSSLEAESLGSFYPDASTYQFGNGWSSISGNEPIVFNISDAKTIYILYKTTKSATGGRVTVVLDGKTVGRINSAPSTAYGDYASTFLALEDSKAESHRLEIYVSSSSPKDDFSILGIMKS